MPGKLARRTLNVVRKTVGMVGRTPRIKNIDLSVDIIGYVEVNTKATTPYSRGKIHKGFFCCGAPEVSNGNLVLDRGDNDVYFVMDRKVYLYNGEAVYVDATLYRSDKTVVIERFQQGARDTFGRVVTVTPTAVTQTVKGPAAVGITAPANSVFAMFNPQNYDILVQKDRVIAQDKIKMCVQSGVDIKVADRVITSDNSTYVVYSIDKDSATGLKFCVLDEDVR